MKSFPNFLTILFLCLATVTNGQDKELAKTDFDSTHLIFKDTLFNLAFDSISHDFGIIKPAKKNNRLVKYFKYVGTDTISITRAWTGDPHFICSYPKMPLVPNKVYSFTICFAHRGKRGRMNKKMGFYLSDGNRITLRFRGRYPAKPKY